MTTIGTHVGTPPPSLAGADVICVAVVSGVADGVPVGEVVEPATGAATAGLTVLGPSSQTSAMAPPADTFSCVIATEDVLLLPYLPSVQKRPQ